MEKRKQTNSKHTHTHTQSVSLSWGFEEHLVMAVVIERRAVLWYFLWSSNSTSLWLNGGYF